MAGYLAYNKSSMKFIYPFQNGSDREPAWAKFMLFDQRVHAEVNSLHR